MTQVAGDIATKGIAFCFWGAFPDVKEKALSYCLAQISAPHTLISYVYTCMSHVWTLISLRFYDCGSFQSLEWNWRECKSLSYWTLFQLPFWACQVVVCWPMFYPTFFGRNRFHVFHGRPWCTSSREGCVVLHKYFDVKASFQLNSNSKRILFHHISIQHYTAIIWKWAIPHTLAYDNPIKQTSISSVCVCSNLQLSAGFVWSAVPLQTHAARCKIESNPLRRVKSWVEMSWRTPWKFCFCSKRVGMKLKTLHQHMSWHVWNWSLLWSPHMQ